MRLIIIGIISTLAGVYLLLLLHLAWSVPRYASYWQHQAAQPSSPDALVYVALGDSAAQGVGALSPSGGYVGQFAERLQANHKRPVRVVNLSKSGARIQDVLKDQLPKLADYQPDVITVDVGANDIAAFDATKFEDQFRELTGKLPKGTVVADIPYFGGRTQLPLFGSGQAEKSVLIANQIITRITKNAPLIVVPLHTATQQRIGGRIWNYAADYFHPNNSGYVVWADTFWHEYNQQK
jgi:acyl-CoA thioesterase-1